MTGLKNYWKIAMVASEVLLVIMLSTASSCYQDMGEEDSEGLPFYAYNSEETLSAYKISQRIPDVLSEVACYCGCGETQGHENLRDCFLNQDSSFNDHGSNCHVCAVEAIDVRTWNDEGMSPEQIAAKIDAKYGEYGNPTKKAQ